MCQSKSYQLLHNSVGTTCITSPEEIEVMELNGYSRPTCNEICASSHDALDGRKCNPQARPSTSFVGYTNTPPTCRGEIMQVQSLGLPSSSVGKVFGHQWLSRWLKFRRSLARGTGKWKDLHPAVAEHDCPEINSSQRWCLCKKTPMWYGATVTWAAAGLLSLARRKTTS